ncbi:MAG: sigma 54-interacting transcriptional regulator [Terriglobales bacterium]|jgi:PAS domain S-box-containing protein
MIAVVDRDHRFVIANRALMNYRGITREQIVGHSIKEVLGEPIYQSKVKPKMEECFRGNIVEYDMKHSYPNLGERDLSITYLPIEGPNGVDRVAAVARDVTDHKRSEEALRSSEERLRLAQEAAQIGTFDRNFLTGESRWTLQQEAIYGLRPGEFPRTIEQFIELVHPDDRQQVSALVAQSMESGEAQGEWRAIWPDGTVRWISGRWRVFRDAEGKPVRAIGSDYDITDRKRIEEELRQAKEKLIEEKLYLEQTIDSELGFEEIVGRSSALRTVMERAGRVAASNATVLLLGETGTGKELVARAIHRLSQRRSNSFIKMNCAAIPTGLLESELFGAEKGAFTGSVSRKVGRLELADKGTIFLDEIGEIASDLQPKLLRVLQDQEFERLGGTQTMKINFRLIAATNRDLADEVQRNHFRSDLYYRLNVFPILIPPLRERREDIPLLVEHFVRKCARRMNKPIARVPSQTLAALVAWDWPGNVRELENFIERSVILTSGSVLAAPLTELQARATSDGRAETLKAAERKHILEALRLSNGRISGENGAAARLGLKRTTLQSKLKQMRIDPRTPPSS